MTTVGGEVLGVYLKAKKVVSHATYERSKKIIVKGNLIRMRLS